MKKKKLFISIAVAIALIAALGATVAFAAEDDGAENGWREKQHQRNHDKSPFLEQLVEDGLITQEQADSIKSGEANLSDFVDTEALKEEYGHPGRFDFREQGNPPEDMLDKLVESGLLTQEQADSILAGDAEIFDFLDRDDLGENGFKRGLGQDKLEHLVEEGLLTQEQADSIAAGDAKISDFIDHENCPQDGELGSKGDFRGRGMPKRSN